MSRFRIGAAYPTLSISISKQTSPLTLTVCGNIAFIKLKMLGHVIEKYVMIFIKSVCFLSVRNDKISSVRNMLALKRHCIKIFNILVLVNYFHIKIY